MKTSTNLSAASASRMTRLALVGLGFAVVLMMSVAIAGAGSVVSGNPTHLAEYRIEDPTTGTYMYGDIEISIVVTETAMGEVFNFVSSEPVVTAVAKGGPNATVYNYNPGVLSASGLHAPVNPSGMWADLSWIGFSFGEGDTPPGDDPPGDDPPGDDPPGDDPPGDDPPGDDPPADDPPADDPPADDPPADDPPADDPPVIEEDDPFLPFTDDPVVKAQEEEYLPFTGGPATLLLGSALAGLAGTVLRRMGR